MIVEYVRKFIYSLGFFELLFLLAFALLGPWLLWSSGNKFKPLSVLLVIADIALFVFFGWDLWAHISTSFGPAMIGLVVVIVACIMLFPVCYLGSMHRSWIKARKVVRDDPTKSIKRSFLRNLFVGTAFLVLVIPLLFVYLPIKLAFLAIGMVMLALAVGWWGGFLVPDVGV